MGVVHFRTALGKSVSKMMIPDVSTLKLWGLGHHAPSPSVAKRGASLLTRGMGTRRIWLPMPCSTEVSE